MSYEFIDPSIEEIKISPGVILLIFARAPNERELNLQIRNIHTGCVIHKFSQPLQPGCKVDFIEQFGDHLLFKKTGGSLQIINVR